MNYDLRGNIKERENLIERAVILENGTPLFPENWIPIKSKKDKSSILLTFEESQKQHNIELLKHTKGTGSGVAGEGGIMGMNAKTLFVSK